MRPFTTIISIDEARHLLRTSVQPVTGVERVPLREAAGRVAAADTASTSFVPPFTRSAMDGYAVSASDTIGASPTSPVTVRIVERIYTGTTPRVRLTPGDCAEIATGAPVPDGADAVVMVEETMPLGDDRVSVRAAVHAGQNIGRRGADISPGDLVVHTGDVLNPSRIGALAAAGRANVEVYRRPKVAVLSTGNEVIAPGEPLGDGQIYDVNRFTLGAVITSHGCDVLALRPARDTVEALATALDACADADVIVFSGGSSVGERDLIPDLVAAHGQMVFHGVAIKPGKPTAFAMVRGVPFFGMPGNPTSCLSNAYILLVPFLRATARLPDHEPRVVRARLDRRIVSLAGRHQFYTVRLHEGAALPAFKGSGEITSLSQADGYIEIPSDQSTVEAGAEVMVTLF